MDDKNKVIVVGVLVAVIACVGAFQVLGRSGPVDSTTVAKQDVKAKPAEVAKLPEIKNPQVATDLPPRDPFAAPADTLPKAPPTVSTRPRGTQGIAPLGRSKFGGMGGIQPLPLGGGPEISPLPGAGSLGHPLPAAEEKPFGYHVVGSISGDRPAVVLEDTAGNQKLVPVGSAVDGESRVRRVEKGAVTIDYRGKKLRLTVGGNPVGK